MNQSSPLDLHMRIAATGIYLPEKILTNPDLEKIVETSDEWIVSRTGIRERRIAAPEERVSHMGARAALQALERAKMDPKAIDLIIVATFTPDAFFPSTACYIQNQIGATRAAAFDLQAACSGFLYGLVVADQFIRTGVYQNILVIGAEKLSSIVDWTDRNTCVLFGDGAGAALVQANRAGLINKNDEGGSRQHQSSSPECSNLLQGRRASCNIESARQGIDETCSKSSGGLLAFQLGASGAHHELLHLKNASMQRNFGQTVEALEPTYLFMSGQEVFKQAVQAMTAAARSVLKQAECPIEEITCLISHQANMRIIEAVGDKLQIPAHKRFVNIEKYGNTSAACIPIALHEAEAQGMIQRGDKLLLLAFGGGLTWAAAILEW